MIAHGDHNFGRTHTQWGNIVEDLTNIITAKLIPVARVFAENVKSSRRRRMDSVHEGIAKCNMDFDKGMQKIKR